MYSPLHAGVGVVLAAITPTPLIGLPLAIASHYLLDALPHGDMRKPPHVLRITEGRRLVITELIDLPLAALVVWKMTTIYSNLSPTVLVLGALAGILPDLLWGGKFLLEKLSWKIPVLTPWLDLHHRWHEWIHIKEARDIPFWAGVGYHLLLIGLLWFAR